MPNRLFKKAWKQPRLVVHPLRVGELLLEGLPDEQDHLVHLRLGLRLEEAADVLGGRDDGKALREEAADFF